MTIHNLRSHAFKSNAGAALADTILQDNLTRMRGNFLGRRERARAGFPEFDALRDAAVEIKNHTLENLDLYLEEFESSVLKCGGQVHWARDDSEARDHILRICRSVNARSVTRGKTMVGEEIGLNAFLESHGIEPVETDLGEYIVQIADEPPSHIIAPAVHKNRAQIADLFNRHHGDREARDPDDIDGLLADARDVLRKKFLDADVGLTGANFLIARTGQTVIVTNEGNGDLTQLLPSVHIVLAGIEKVVPTLTDATTMLRILARSATGQEMSSYTTFSAGPRRSEDIDGPEEFHVILLDNGRARMIGSPEQDLLRCIRCGCCLNACPVYGKVGGHAYGSTYPGPIGAVLSPSLAGIAQTRDLPNASSLCGRCEEVCPVRIPIPKILRHFRNLDVQNRTAPSATRHGLALWAALASRPRFWGLATGLAIRIMTVGNRGRYTRFPFAGAWTRTRDLAAPQGGTFQSRWRMRTSR